MRQFISRPKNSVQFTHFKQTRQNIKDFNKISKKGSKPMTHFKNYKRTAFFIFMALMNISIFSQANQEWVSRTGSGISDQIRESISLDANGNIISACNKQVTKFNSSGVQQWEVINNNYMFYTMAVDNANNIYAAGSVSIGSHSRFLVVKYSPAGNVLWAAQYGDSLRYNLGSSLAVDNNGNAYLIGVSSREFPYNNHGYYTMKFNSNGILQWVKNDGGYASAPTNPKGNLAIDQNSNVYISYPSAEPSVGHTYFVKRAQDGTDIWTVDYLGYAGNSLKVDPNGNMFVAGFGKVMKYNNAGIFEWETPYNGNFYDLKIDASGNVYAAGNSGNYPQQASDFLLIKINSSGSMQWSSTYNGPANDKDYATAMALTNSGIYLTGGSTGSGTNIDYATVKFNFSGNIQWAIRYNYSSFNGIDEAKNIIVDPNGNIFIAGVSESTYHDNQHCVIKYSDVTGITPITGEMPKEYNLSQNYPNPFNPSTKIRFSLPQSADVKLTVFDITGKVVAELANGNFNAGTYEADWNAAMLSSGTYFYRLTAGRYTETKKMILVK